MCPVCFMGFGDHTREAFSDCSSTAPSVPLWVTPRWVAGQRLCQVAITEIPGVVVGLSLPAWGMVLPAIQVCGWTLGGRVGAGLGCWAARAEVGRQALDTGWGWPREGCGVTARGDSTPVLPLPAFLCGGC